MCVVTVGTAGWLFCWGAVCNMTGVAALLRIAGASPQLVDAAEADAVSAALVALGVVAFLALALGGVRLLRQLLAMVRGRPDLQRLCGTATWAC
eukprot:COSAG02_NODE_38028_length_434_cov_0.949254_1_plen_93_part_01